MTDDELKERVASLITEQKETNSRLAHLEEQVKDLNAQLNSCKKLEDFSFEINELIKSQFEITKDFFMQCLLKDNRLGSLQFNDIQECESNRRGNIQETNLFFISNDDTVALIEVKDKAHSKDLDKLDRKMANFKKLYPIYQNYKLYGALASFHIHDDLKNEAMERGYFVLQRSGDLVHSDCRETLKTL